jgi:hypothetical protein
MSTQAVSHSVDKGATLLSNISTKDAVIGVAGGALVCTTCYLIFRNYQLSSQNAQTATALRKAGEAIQTTKQAIRLVQEELDPSKSSPSVATSSSIETISNLFSPFTGGASLKVVKADEIEPSHLSISAIALLGASFSLNEEAEKAIRQVMPHPSISLSQNRPVSEEPSFVGSFVQGVAKGTGQELGRVAVQAANPVSWLQSTAIGGLKWATNWLEGKI